MEKMSFSWRPPSSNKCSKLAESRNRFLVVRKHEPFQCWLQTHFTMSVAHKMGQKIWLLGRGGCAVSEFLFGDRVSVSQGDWRLKTVFFQ